MGFSWMKGGCLGVLFKLEDKNWLVDLHVVCCSLKQVGLQIGRDA